jgi:hypothetical protein
MVDIDISLESEPSQQITIRSPTSINFTPLQGQNLEK